LGLVEGEIDKIVYNPKQITYNLPAANTANQIIEV